MLDPYEDDAWDGPTIPRKFFILVRVDPHVDGAWDVSVAPPSSGSAAEHQ